MGVDYDKCDLCHKCQRDQFLDYCSKGHVICKMHDENLEDCVLCKKKKEDEELADKICELLNEYEDVGQIYEISKMFFKLCDSLDINI